MLKRYLAVFFLIAAGALSYAASADGSEWRALLISGGGVPASNAVAHEKNILFAQRTLVALGLSDRQIESYVSLGKAEGRDVSYIAGLPSERWELGLLDRLFGQGGIELGFRRHQIAAVSGTARKAEVLRAIHTASGRLSKGDTLFLYGTDHGQRNETNLDDNYLVLWGDERLAVSELRANLVPAGEQGRVVAVFAQCYSGAFANFMYAADGVSLAKQDRCGFFSTVPSREAAGCTPELDEAEYDDYSTRFFAAVGGTDRLGGKVPPTDYNADGKVNFSEAHAYAIASEETIDVPVKTSEVFLERAQVAIGGDWSAALASALPEEQAAWRALQKRLGFAGDSSTAVAKGLDAATRGLDLLYEEREAALAELGALEADLRLSLLERWPFLETPFHPEFAALMQTGGAVRAVLAQDKRVGTLNQQYTQYGVLADKLMAAEIEEAWWLRADRLYRHILRAANAKGKLKRAYARLQACEATIMTDDR